MGLTRTIALPLAAIAMSCSLLCSPVVHAWDGGVSGTISQLDVTSGANYGLRIVLAGVPAMCNGGLSWAYLNDSDSNYKTYVAALMVAKAQGTKVLVYSNLEGGYCHIGYISVSS